MVDEELLARMMREPVYVRAVLQDRTWSRMKKKLVEAGFGLSESGKGHMLAVQVYSPRKVS